tara:strand:+ start:1913 stop:2725 length:813 start_codon:yes stop_codon:yes gene_type:complete
MFEEVKNKAFKGGIAGSSAMIIQVSSLMWLRTIMNYQYANGGNIKNTLKILYKQGGLLRFYRGYTIAIFQGPISRFGDTAANIGILELTNDTGLPLSIRTGLASISAGIFRISITPIDTLKTTLQVHGKNGVKILNNKIKFSGPLILWNGALASSLATMVGHYPWFLTYNYLNEYIPKQESQLKNLIRQAGIGFTSSIISDICSNSIRVIKTTKQTYPKNIKYSQVINYILKTDGYKGLFLRGLDTRIIANGLNGMMFSVMWKFFMDKNN